MDDLDDPLREVANLLEKATRHQENGLFRDAERLAVRAKEAAGANIQACAEIDLFQAILLLEERKTAEGTKKLSAMLIEYEDWFKGQDGRGVYERAQLERAFSLMHLEKYEEARPILEEAASFDLNREVRSDLHCHLGRCYHTLSQFGMAKAQFESADSLGVNEGWQSAFHYYFGYTLYELKDFNRAKREFILCLQSGASGPEEWMRYAMLAAASRKLGEHSEASEYDRMAKALKR